MRRLARLGRELGATSARLGAALVQMVEAKARRIGDVTGASRAPHPDAELLRAWGELVAACRSRRALPHDDSSIDDDVQPYNDALWLARRKVQNLPACTPAGLALKLRLALTNHTPLQEVDDAMIFGTPLPQGYFDNDATGRLLWGAIQDAERMARKGAVNLMAGS